MKSWYTFSLIWIFGRYVGQLVYLGEFRQTADFTNECLNMPGNQLLGELVEQSY